MSEIWKPIANFEGSYEISSHGRIKSLVRQDSTGNGNRVKERLLKPDVSCRKSTKYHRITLCKNGKTSRFQVHRLVAEHFIPNPENKPFVNHIDNNGLNNHIENLERCTHSENMEHSAKQGRQDKVHLLGGHATAAINQQKAEQFYQHILGHRFIRTFIVDKRRKIELYCEHCSQPTIVNGSSSKYGFPRQCRKCSYKTRSSR